MERNWNEIWRNIVIGVKMKKYEVHNQLTGLLEQASSFDEAKQLQARLLDEYWQSIKDGLFQITVLVENDDGSWTQSLSDDSGEPVPQRQTSIARPTKVETI